MDTRLRRIVIKARPPPDLQPAIEPLLAVLREKLTTKRLYEDTFSTPEDAEGFAIKHGLPADQLRLLVLMQHHKSIYVPNKLLDNVLTGLFLVECLLVVFSVAQSGLLAQFLFLCVITDATITRVKDWSAYYGCLLSTWLHRHGFVDCDPLSGKIQLKKWTDQAWQLAVHIACTLVELHILASEPWYDDPVTCFLPHPVVQAGHHSVELQLLYVGSLAVWIYTCIVHRFFDERKRDYFQMYIHHIATIALIGLSWHVSYLRIGMLVMYVHDVSDIFIDLLKMTNFLKLEGPRGLFLSEVAYVFATSFWLYYRLYQYPFRVVHGAFVFSYRIAGVVPRLDDGLLELFPGDVPYWQPTNVLLVVLQCLHVYWFYLLFMVGYRILTESAGQASRAEYEGDSDVDDDDSGGGPKGKLVSNSSSSAQSGEN